MGAETVDLTHGALVGVLNVTPDSFSDGGEYLDPDKAVAHGLQMIADGAALVDVGGESTRPGAQPVAADLEMSRVMPVVQGLVAEGVVVSIDTSKPQVAAEALAAGVDVVNDVGGLTNPGMVAVVRGWECGVVIMHKKGDAVDHYAHAGYRDVVVEVEDFLITQVERVVMAGVDRRRIVIDPGIGFGKRAHDSISLLANVGRLSGHGVPVMVGTSRKRFLGTVSGDDTIKGRDGLTAVTTALAYACGARLFRVHDVARSRDALRLAAAIVADQ